MLNEVSIRSSIKSTVIWWKKDVIFWAESELKCSGEKKKKVCCEILYLGNCFCILHGYLLRFPFYWAFPGRALSWWRCSQSGFGGALVTVSRRETVFVLIVKILLLQSYLSSNVWHDKQLFTCCRCSCACFPPFRIHIKKKKKRVIVP